MAHQLEAPGDDDSPEWDSLFRARGEEVADERPVFTGDVFAGVQVAGEAQAKMVILLQHPCAIRLDGVHLMPKLLVAEIVGDQPLPPSEWAGGFYKQLPLAELQPDGRPRHGRALFHKHHLATPDELDGGRRIACLSQVGVNLLLQRWVHHNSRAVIPTQQYQEVSAPQYEEADIAEDWCFERAEDGLDIETATIEIDAWLSAEDDDGESQRDRLNDEQLRSQVRQDARAYLKQLRGGG